MKFKKLFFALSFILYHSGRWRGLWRWTWRWWRWWWDVFKFHLHQAGDNSFSQSSDKQEDKTTWSYHSPYSTSHLCFHRLKISRKALEFKFHLSGLTIVCNDYFVPALTRVSDALCLTPDVAGATLMAAGSSAPELATSVIAVFVSKVKFTLWNWKYWLSLCELARCWVRRAAESECRS